MKAMLKFYTGMVIAAILMSMTANAQHVNFGVKGGVNFYNIQNENSPKYDMKTGFHLGLLGHIHLDRSIALQPELVYSTQGAKYTSGGVEYKLKLSYINVPVMLQYMFDNGFRLEAGPQVGFLINAENNSVSVKNNYKSVDFGVGLGAGYIKPSTGFGVSVRYNAGLSDINESSSVKSTNSGFQLGVFYQFKHN